MAEDRVVTDPATESTESTAPQERSTSLTGRGVRARLARIGTSRSVGN